jgi:hypothetical protein
MFHASLPDQAIQVKTVIAEFPLQNFQTLFSTTFPTSLVQSMFYFVAGVACFYKFEPFFPWFRPW